jgi:hypothetical protein
MALSLVEVQAYTEQLIVPRTVDTIYKNSPVFTRLHTKNMERFNGGLYIQTPIIFAELNGDAIGRGAAFNIDPVNTDTALVNYMRLYYVNISLYGFDSIANDGPLAALNQVETKFVNAGLKMGKLLGVNMYLDSTGPGRGNQLDGLQMWYDDGTLYPVVGGITRSDIMPTGVVGGLNAYTATTSAFNLQQLNIAYGNAWFGSDHVDLIQATQNGWNLVWNAMQPSQRYLDKDSDVATAGFQSLRFNASEIVIDKYAPSAQVGSTSLATNGLMLGMNTNYIYWYFSTNPKFRFGWTGFKEGQNTIDVAGQQLVATQLVVPNPRTGFKILSPSF